VDAPLFRTTARAEPEPRRRRPHRELTPAQRSAIAVAAAVAAVGCLLADAAPTGLRWLDAAYLAASGVLLVVAGTRARRWSLVVGSAVSAAAATGWALALGIVAVALAVFLIGRNRRDRVVGAVIGGCVAVVALHLSIDWFTGASTLVGLVAVGPILVSGLHNCSDPVRRRWYRAIAVCGALVVAGLAVAVTASVMSVDDLEAGINATRAGVRATQDGEEEQAVARFRAAHRSLGSAADLTRSWWASFGRAVPLIGQNLAVVQDLSGAGADLTSAASDIAANVDYQRIRRPDGGIDLDVLRSFREPVLQAAATLRDADDRVTALASEWNLAPLQSRLEEFGSKVRQLHHQTALAALAIDRAPAILGGSGARRYLVLLGNPAEARDLGGHLGNWVELDADDGHLSMAASGSPMDLSLGLAADATLVAGYPPSLTEMKPLPYPQNWGSSPDMTAVAQMSADLYQRKTGRTIDGVLYADPYAFAGLLEITGPIPVAGLGAPLRSDDAVRFLTQDQFAAFPDEATGNDAVGQLVRDTFDRITHVELPGPKQISDIFRPTVRHGRLKFASLHDDDGPLLAALGLDGALSLPDGGDVVGVINRNANPSKIDAYLHRSTTVAVRWDPGTGEVAEDVTVTLRNEAPATGLPATVIGNQAGLPPGTNLTDVVLLSSYRLRTVELDGQATESSPLFDGLYWRHGVRVPLAPGQTRTVTYHLAGSVARSDHYRAFVVGQPLLDPGALRLTVTPTDGSVVGGRGISVRKGAASVRVEPGVNTAVDLRVRR
jgi:hypothetical protein